MINAILEVLLGLFGKTRKTQEKPSAVKDAAFIHQWEGLRLSAYLDVAGVWTIGYGTTRNVRPGMKISKEQAAAFFRRDLIWVEQSIEDLVKVEINQNQYDALASFIYNLGRTNFSNSTLLKKLNEGNYREAADQFLAWDKARDPNTGKLRSVKGLQNRRRAERLKFLS